jgi:hypothetical protein
MILLRACFVLFWVCVFDYSSISDLYNHSFS